MPIFRIGDKLHYFAHVPKCGGTSIETYIGERFGPLGMYEANRYDVPAHLRWTRTSLVHVRTAQLATIYPPEWIASSFAVVRNPVRRLMSAFFFARDTIGSISLSTDFNDWFHQTAPRLEREPYLYGGHLLTQSDQVPEDARIFRFEDGLEPVVDHLDALAGNCDGPRTLTTKNVGRWRAEGEALKLTETTLALITSFYAADFARFGYDIPTHVTEAAGLPDLPALAATGAPPVPQRRPLLRRIERRLVRIMEQK